MPQPSCYRRSRAHWSLPMRSASPPSMIGRQGVGAKIERIDRLVRVLQREQYTPLSDNCTLERRSINSDRHAITSIESYGIFTGRVRFADPLLWNVRYDPVSERMPASRGRPKSTIGLNRSRGRAPRAERHSHGWTMGACCLTMKRQKHIPEPMIVQHDDRAISH
jgi:hypothetical protein